MTAESAHSNRGWDRRFLLTVAIAVLFAVLIPNAVLVGDPLVYRERIVEVLSEGAPYATVPMEHFPGTLIPMFLAWVMGGFTGDAAFVFAFVLAMAACLWLVGRLLLPFAFADGTTAASRFLVLIFPLLPLVLFRNDPWVVLLALAGCLQQPGSSWLFGLAILSKGWPIALLPVMHWPATRRKAMIVIGLAIAALVMVIASPGYRATQSANEIHAETLLGGFLGLTNALRGQAPPIVWGLRAQLAVPLGIVVLNAVPGLLILGMTMRRLKGNSGSVASFMAACGGLTIGATLALPALSAQYLLWFAPFVSFARRSARLKYFVANLLTLIVVLRWFEIFEASVGFWSLLMVRNGLILWLGLELALASGAKRLSTEEDAERAYQSIGRTL